MSATINYEGNAANMAAAIRAGADSSKIGEIDLANAFGWGCFGAADRENVSDLIEAMREENKKISESVKDLKDDTPVEAADTPKQVEAKKEEDTLTKLQKLRTLQGQIVERLKEQKKLSEDARRGITMAEQKKVIEEGIPGKIMATAVRATYAETMEVAFAKEELDVLEAIKADIDAKYPRQAK